MAVRTTITRSWLPLFASTLLACGSDHAADQPEALEAEVDAAEAAVDVAPDVAPTPDEQATFDALVASMTKKLSDAKVPGGAISVVLRGKLAFSAGVGVKRDDGADPITEDSLFRVASLTKALVATGIMQLVEAGLVDLSHPVRRSTCCRSDVHPWQAIDRAATNAQSLHLRIMSSDSARTSSLPCRSPKKRIRDPLAP